MVSTRGHCRAQLRNFANAARQLGSSVAILSSAFHLRERLAQILYLYRENAADLFPRKINHLSKDNTVDARAETRRRRRWRVAQTKALPHVARPTVNEDLDLEFFPQQLEALAADVTTFLKCLNEFPEFTDEAVNASIMSFEGDLKVCSALQGSYPFLTTLVLGVMPKRVCWSVFFFAMGGDRVSRFSCTGHFRYPSVQRYIHELAIEMGEHIDNITVTLSMFIEIGMTFTYYLHHIYSCYQHLCRGAHHPVRSETRGKQSSQLIYGGNLLLRRNCNNTSVLLQPGTHAVSELRQLLLVRLNGLQHRSCRK